MKIFPWAKIGKIFTGNRCVVYIKNYGNWYLPPYSTEVLDSCYRLADGRLMVMLPNVFTLKQGPLIKIVVLNQRGEKKSYKSI